MRPHHEAWLTAHPERTRDWLKGRLADGFDVHHLDDDRTNNEPHNLVLIEALDHMRLHGISAVRRHDACQKGGRASAASRMRKSPEERRQLAKRAWRTRRRQTLERKQAQRRKQNAAKNLSTHRMPLQVI